jgi:SusD/RagB-like outer membrane lipoprotein
MKLKYMGRAIGATALFVSAVSCNPDSLTNLNRNPNTPEAATPQLLFPSGVLSADTLFNGSSMQLYFTELWSQHIAEYQYPDDDQYVIRPTTIDAYWLNLYSVGTQDFELILRQSTGKPDQAGPALVMKSWTYQNATDLWGDIPYSQANQGDKGNITPVYDTQQAIYNGLIADLKTAATTMGSTNPYGSADLIYGGSNAQWKKFANSLRARVALHLSKVDPTKAATEVAAAVAAGGFTSNDDNAEVHWPGDGQNDSQYFVTFLTRDDHRLSRSLVDTLKSLNDPRLPIYARSTQDWQADSAHADSVGLPLSSITTPRYGGMENGLSASDAATKGKSSSRVGTYFSQADSPSYLMTYSEFLFIEAEAANRGWIAGGDAQAATYYDAAITASMEQYGIDAASITTYLAQPSVAYTPGAAGLAKINLQKWIALYRQGIEAWTEYRRTGVPNLTPAAEGQTTPKIVPRRLEYPVSEQSFNNTNLQAAITRQGGATLTSHFYWDKP